MRNSGNGDLNQHGQVRRAPAIKADNFEGAWEVKRGDLLWEDAESQFLRSRKLGIYGATRAVKPRTIEEYRWDLKQLFDFMRERGVNHYAQLSEKLVLDYIEHLQSKDWSIATQRKYLISLRAFLRWVERDPSCRGLESFVRFLPRIPKAVRKSFVPSVEHMEMFRAGFDRKVIWGLRDYTAVSFMLDTGARIGEVCNLEESDFKWEVCLVNLDGKTGERLVPFDRETTGLFFRNWMRARYQFAHPDCHKVFITRFGGRCTPNTFLQSFSDNLKRTGLSKILGDGTISCHTVRHYFCTMYLVNGGTLHGLQRITGHKNIETLMIYVHLANQINAIAKEHAVASPLKQLTNREVIRESKRRRMVRF